MIDFFEFQLRPRVLYKAGLVDDIGPEIANLGAKRALIVADEGVAHAGLLPDPPPADSTARLREPSCGDHTTQDTITLSRSSHQPPHPNR